jgi:hypothetical protein
MGNVIQPWKEDLPTNMNDWLRLAISYQAARLRGLWLRQIEKPPNCLRCDRVPLTITDCYPGIRNYECSLCFRRFSQKDAHGLCDRWLSPITLPLYAFLFDGHLIGSVNNIAKQFRQNEDPAYLKLMCQEIKYELDHPAQQLTDMYESRHSESELRDFLRQFVAALENEQ